MDLGIGKVVSNGDGDAIIYTAVLAAIVANCMPTPADAIYFWRQSVDKDLLESGKITPKQYWVRDGAGYYLYTASWYAGIFTVLAATGGSYQTKAKILLALLSAGLVVGVIAKNIQKDEEIKDLASQQEKALYNSSIQTS
jgi:hypothetical protein